MPATSSNVTRGWPAASYRLARERPRPARAPAAPPPARRASQMKSATSRMTGPNDSRIVNSSERPSSIGLAFTTTSCATSSCSSSSSAKAGRIVSKSVSVESEPSG